MPSQGCLRDYDGSGDVGYDLRAEEHVLNTLRERKRGLRSSYDVSLR